MQNPNKGEAKRARRIRKEDTHHNNLHPPPNPFTTPASSFSPTSLPVTRRKNSRLRTCIYCYYISPSCCAQLFGEPEGSNAGLAGMGGLIAPHLAHLGLSRETHIVIVAASSLCGNEKMVWLPLGGLYTVVRTSVVQRLYVQISKSTDEVSRWRENCSEQHIVEIEKR